MNGRPLRFLGVAIGGWVAVRAVMLWPAAGPPALPRALIPAAVAKETPAPAPQPAAMTVPPSPVWNVAPRQLRRSIEVLTARSLTSETAIDPKGTPIARSISAQSGRVVPPPLVAAPSPLQPVTSAPRDRWSASAWLVLRDGRGLAPGLGGGQLGGGQAGARIAYALTDRVAVVARIASPLRGKGREAALGLEWRPTKLPVRLVAEYRASLDGGGSGPAAGIIAGTGPAPLAFGFDLETYGQAGIIRRRRTEPFAEGAARLSRPVVTIGGARVDLGLGGWGGAQRGAQRLDLGPSLGVRVPVAGTSLRLSFDWRQRVAGKARPGSGPVLTIGGDF